MKRLITALLSIVLVLGLTSCLKPKHELRIKNAYSKAARVVIGPNNYGTTLPGGTSSYQSIPDGDHSISGDVIGSVSINGKGKHKWTLTITNTGSVTIAEDKK